jgi:5'-phosphate synthase pdxT subunit
MIGVIGVQGAVSEHIDMLLSCGSKTRWVRTKDDLDGLDGIILPGGESTTISRLLVESGMFERIQEMAEEGIPVFGTCAGLVLLANQGDDLVQRTNQKLLGLMDMRISRNSFGNQRNSFEAMLDIDGIGEFPGVFIRAPAIEEVNGDCKALSSFNGKIVAAQQGNLLAAAFHPELSGDMRMHEYFISML